MFTIFEKNLRPGGRVSLSYYHPDYWHLSTAYSFEHSGKTVYYKPSFDLSERELKRGIWRDEYESQGEEFRYEYKVRIYENTSDIEEMFSHTRLKFIEEIRDYNNPKIIEPGWIEYVLELSV